MLHGARGCRSVGRGRSPADAAMAALALGVASPELPRPSPNRREIRDEPQGQREAYKLYMEQLRLGTALRMSNTHARTLPRIPAFSPRCGWM